MKINPLLLIGLAVAVGAFFMRNRIQTALVSGAERITRTRRLIAEEEGLRRFAYKDSAGKWTIGIGHLIVLPQEQHLLSYTPTNQAPDSVVYDLFDKDLAIAKRGIAMVKVPLSDSQYVALASLIFNIGLPSFMNSTVLRELNAGNYKGAADAMLMWRKITVNGTKQDSPALLARRERERKIFLA